MNQNADCTTKGLHTSNSHGKNGVDTNENTFSYIKTQSFFPFISITFTKKNPVYMCEYLATSLLGGICDEISLSKE